MRFNRNVIQQLLDSQDHPKAERAGRELPAYIDTDSIEHRGLLRAYGISATQLTNNLASPVDLSEGI